MTLMGPNYSTVQEQLRIMKSGTEQEKSKITPDSIRDIRAYIEQERKVSGRNYSLEGEFKEWEDLAKNYESEKGQITAATANATANTAATVGQGVTESNGVISDVNPEKIKSLKTALENEANSPLTPDGLTKILERLKEERNPDNRAVITSYIWSKMNHGGYTTTIMNGNISVEHTTDKMGATSLEKTLQAHISANILTLADIQRAMIVGPDSFRKYLDTQKVDIRNATTNGYAVFIMKSRGIDLTRANTPEQKTRIIQNSKSTPDEKAFLLSYVNGGLKTYNITPELDRQIKMNAIGAEIKASPEFKAVNKAIETTSGGGAKAEKKKMEEAGEELTWNTFINNPMKAVAKYPWTSLGIILGSMYKFGIMKTLLGLVGGVLGYKVIEEWGGIEALNKKESNKKGESETPKKGPKKQQKPLELDHTLDLSKKPPNEKKLWENLQATPSIKKTLNSRKETLGSYMEFIDKNNLLTKTLGDLVYTDPHDASIFSNRTNLPAGIQSLPGGIDSVMLKRILRVLISGVDRYGITDPDGLSHTNNYKSWVLEANVNSIDESTWKAKKIVDIVPDIAKKFNF